MGWLLAGLVFPGKLDCGRDPMTGGYYLNTTPWWWCLAEPCVKLGLAKIQAAREARPQEVVKHESNGVAAKVGASCPNGHEHAEAF